MEGFATREQVLCRQLTSTVITTSVLQQLAGCTSVVHTLSWQVRLVSTCARRSRFALYCRFTEEPYVERCFSLNALFASSTTLRRDRVQTGCEPDRRLGRGRRRCRRPGRQVVVALLNSASLGVKFGMKLQDVIAMVKPALHLADRLKPSSDQTGALNQHSCPSADYRWRKGLANQLRGLCLWGLSTNPVRHGS